MSRIELHAQLLCAALTGIVAADTDKKLKLDEISSHARDIAYWVLTDFEKDLKDI
jgi:hypothetical protein